MTVEEDPTPPPDSPDPGTRRERLLALRRRVFVDLSPLRESRDFRLIYAGQFVSIVGRQLTVVASSLQVFLLTDSSLAVGLLGLAQLGPLLVCSLVGGAIADAFDRRRTLMWTQVALAATSVGLALNASVDAPLLWPIFVLTAASAGLSAIDGPTRTAAIATLVRREQIPAAAALQQTAFQVSLIAGPSLAGLVIAQVSVAAAYWLDAITFSVVLLSVMLVRPLIPEGGGTRPGLHSVREGLRFLRRERAIQGTFLVDINAMVFGMPRALFPELGLVQFGGGPQTVGLLYAAPGVGALLAALTTGWVSQVRRPGWAVLMAVLAWGAAIAAFGLVPWLAVGLGLLAVAGAADVVSAVFRNTILQLQVPDRLRGRLNAINVGVVTGGPRLGDLEAGGVAALTTVRVSVVSGGLACMAGVALVARLIPELAAWTPPKTEADDSAADPDVDREGDADAQP
ncbi:MAG: MFS transporter [Acidimicrobiales bacterium]